MSLSKVLLTTGALLVLHAAYSLQHYRALIQDLEESATGISSEVLLVDSSSSSSSKLPTFPMRHQRRPLWKHCQRPQ